MWKHCHSETPRRRRSGPPVALSGVPAFGSHSGTRFPPRSLASKVGPMAPSQFLLPAPGFLRERGHTLVSSRAILTCHKQTKSQLPACPPPGPLLKGTSRAHHVRGNSLLSTRVEARAGRGNATCPQSQRLTRSGVGIWTLGHLMPKSTFQTITSLLSDSNEDLDNCHTQSHTQRETHTHVCTYVHFREKVFYETTRFIIDSRLETSANINGPIAWVTVVILLTNKISESLGFHVEETWGAVFVTEWFW